MAEQLIDVNVSLGHWPFQRFAVRTAAQLDEHLRHEGIVEAWVGAMDSVLYPDPDVYDDLLAAELRDYPHLKFVKTINPTLSNWRAGLDKADFAIRLYPNYHEYAFTDERLTPVLEEAQRRGLLVQVVMRVDDERNQYRLMMVPAVSVEAVLPIVQRFPDLRFVILNGYYGEAAQLLGCPNVSVDTALIERIETLGSFLKRANEPDRILFGSYTPMLYTRSAILKLRTANDEEVRRRIGFDNACALRGA
jgi:hypothetical protein